MIGPADIEDMMLDYAAESTTVAERQVPDPQPHSLLGWAWWLSPTALLAFEAQNVVELRMVRLAWGGQEARDEMASMIVEKIAAAIEAAGTLMNGGSLATVGSRYREHVAANTKRLTQVGA